MALGDFTAVQTVIKLSAAPKSEWDTLNLVLPMGFQAWETDTKKMKIGDGTTAYTDLAYAVDQALTADQKALLDNAGAADGVCVLDSAGLVPLSVLPEVAKSHIQYLADIATRDAIAEADRNYLYVVLDASADTTVTGGYAVYAWDTTSTAWVKVSEGESMDIDFTVFFNKTTETLDDINDGASYVRFTPAERTKLSKALVNDETYVFVSPDPTTLATILA